MPKQHGLRMRAQVMRMRAAAKMAGVTWMYASTSAFLCVRAQGDLVHLCVFMGVIARAPASERAFVRDWTSVFG